MPRRTQAERRAQTGSALLQAAAELVVEGGVAALTLARVGERAGYSRGIVTHHFGSKQALVEALARVSQAGFVPGVGDEPGLDRLLVLIDGYVARLGAAGPLRRAFLLLWAESLTSPELAEIFRERDEGFRADLRTSCGDQRATPSPQNLRRRQFRGRAPADQRRQRGRASRMTPSANGSSPWRWTASRHRPDWRCGRS